MSFKATLEINFNEDFELKREAWGRNKATITADFEEKCFKDIVEANFSIGDIYSDTQVIGYVNESYEIDTVFTKQQIIEWVKNNLTLDEIQGVSNG